jgi:hypothetical protein
MLPVPKLNKQLPFVEVNNRLLPRAHQFSDGVTGDQQCGFLLFIHLSSVSLLVAPLLFALADPMSFVATVTTFVACDVVVP